MPARGKKRVRGSEGDTKFSSKKHKSKSSRTTAPTSYEEIYKYLQTLYQLDKFDNLDFMKY